jgi:hypothetical protein
MKEHPDHKEKDPAIEDIAPESEQTEKVGGGKTRGFDPTNPNAAGFDPTGPNASGFDPTSPNTSGFDPTRPNSDAT